MTMLEELARAIHDTVENDDDSGGGAYMRAAQAILPIITREIDRAKAEGWNAAERRVVEWLREENGLCDCHARSEDECGCGAWQDYKTKPLLDIADAIERGEHRSRGIA